MRRRAAACGFVSLGGAALLFCLPVSASALEVVAVDTAAESRSIRVELEVVLDAPMDRVIDVLTDYDRIHELHPRFRDSGDLGSPAPGVTEVYTVFRGCLAVFCRTVRRVERLQRTPTGLLAVEVPGRSDFAEGRTEWRFRAEGNQRTRLYYRAVLEPDFLLPPLFGRRVLAEMTRETTVEMLAAAERVARGEP
ncbi:MAG: SRPBCC family protein [Gammaproteobacteria bacterium]